MNLNLNNIKNIAENDLKKIVNENSLNRDDIKSFIMHLNLSILNIIEILETKNFNNTSSNKSRRNI